MKIAYCIRKMLVRIKIQLKTFLYSLNLELHISIETKNQLRTKFCRRIKFFCLLTVTLNYSIFLANLRLERINLYLVFVLIEIRRP